jgi:glucose/arabinose dehydrogenase
MSVVRLSEMLVYRPVMPTRGIGNVIQVGKEPEFVRFNLIPPVTTMAGQSSPVALSVRLKKVGDGIPKWTNILFVACLSGQHLDRPIIRNNKVVGEERLSVDKHQRLVDVTYLNNTLCVITDDGGIYRIGKQ